jgi:general secretion pathway protein G
MRNRVTKGFTLVEILIVVVILGILAAIVIPQFTTASTDAQVGNVKSQLQTIRSQIELYRVKNNGNAPALDGAQDASFTDLITDPDAEGPDRPFMQTRPLNPRNNRNQVAAGGAAEAVAAPASNTGPGWYYDAATGQVFAAGFDEATGRWVVAEAE